VPRWADRAAQIGATAVPTAEALPLLQALWSTGRLLPPLDDADWERLAPRLSFHRVGAGQTLIAQDEPGEFLLVLLDGSVLIEHHGAPAGTEGRAARGGAAAAATETTAEAASESAAAVPPGAPWPRLARPPGVVRLAEARPGDVVGEMALLDAGPRSSACVTRTPCLVAALAVDVLAALMHDDPPLAAVVMAALARRLSLRLRQADARLAALLAPQD
jgi:CRP-like cAMP-binding protein